MTTRAERPPDMKRAASPLAADEAARETAGTPNDTTSPFASRRRFCVLAVMAGWAAPARLVERIVNELKHEATP